MRRWWTLRGDRRGNASVEFALLSMIFFGGVIVALDFGIFVQQKLKLGAAVEQAAMLAYNTKVTTNTSTISSYITSNANTKQTPTVAITCNGTSTCGDGKCSCVTASGGFTIMGSCNSLCVGANLNPLAYSGNYLKIVATETYQPMVVPDRILGGSSLVQTAVVRMQ